MYNFDKIWLHSLYESDRTTLLDHSEWLNDNHITCAQNLLKELFPEFGGLESTIKQQAGALKPLPLQGLQISHIDGNHWIAAPTVNCPHEADIVADIVLCDSMYSTINPQTELLLSELVHTNRPFFYVGFGNVSKQSGSVDCVLFPMAYITDVSFGRDPSFHVYTQKKMRHTISSNLLSKKIEPFPISRKRTALNLFHLCQSKSTVTAVAQNTMVTRSLDVMVSVVSGFT